MNPDLLGASGSGPYRLERRLVASVSTVAGRMLFSDAFERIRPDDVGDVQAFDLRANGQLDIGVVWATRVAKDLPPGAAAIFVGSVDEWGPGDWRPIVASDGGDARVLCDGGALLVFPFEAVEEVMEIQADHARLSNLIRAVMEGGPLAESSIVAVPSADGAFPCWGRMDADDTLTALTIDLEYLD